MTDILTKVRVDFSLMPESKELVGDKDDFDFNAHIDECFYIKKGTIDEMRPQLKKVISEKHNISENRIHLYYFELAE